MQGFNKYYPPDWDPSQGNLNEFHGTHALGVRAKKLRSEGKLVVRFEMPFNVWCTSCKSHIAMGVRFNAEKQQIGMYHSTPLYEFVMKCHLCGEDMVIRTDPQNNTYLMVKGVQQKIQEWTPDDEDGLGSHVHERFDEEHKTRLSADPMYQLEHTRKDVVKQMMAKPEISRLQELSHSRGSQDYDISRTLRTQMRERKARESAAHDRYAQQVQSTGVTLVLKPLSVEDDALARRMSQLSDMRRATLAASAVGASSAGGVDASLSSLDKGEAGSEYGVYATSVLNDSAGRVGAEALRKVNPKLHHLVSNSRAANARMSTAAATAAAAAASSASSSSVSLAHASLAQVLSSPAAPPIPTVRAVPKQTRANSSSNNNTNNNQRSNSCNSSSNSSNNEYINNISIRKLDGDASEKTAQEEVVAAIATATAAAVGGAGLSVLGYLYSSDSESESASGDSDDDDDCGNARCEAGLEGVSEGDNAKAKDVVTEINSITSPQSSRPPSTATQSNDAATPHPPPVTANELPQPFAPATSVQGAAADNGQSLLGRGIP